MNEFIELYDWACWKFATFEYRLCGYNDQGGTVRCIITEPILGVNIEDQFVETTNNLKFKLHEPIQKVNMMDMTYIIDKWMSQNIKGEPSDTTNMVLEALGRTPDGKKVERTEDEPREEKPIKTDEVTTRPEVKSSESSKRKTKDARAIK